MFVSLWLNTGNISKFLSTAFHFQILSFLRKAFSFVSGMFSSFLCILEFKILSWWDISAKHCSLAMQNLEWKRSQKLDCFICSNNVIVRFWKRLWLNLDGFVKLLEIVVKTWLERVTVGKSHVWQKDLEPCPTFKKSQKWLLDNFYDFTSPIFRFPNSLTD